MYRLGLESVLGLRPLGPCFAMAPCIPASWERFRILWNHAGCRYRIEVRNPERRNVGVASATLDGVAVDPDVIPLAGDGGEHRVVVVMGEPAGRLVAAVGAGTAAASGEDGRER
jgi:cellobiose phosphorylase